MLNETDLRSEQITENRQMTMSIDTVNIITSYSGDSKQLTFAILVVDLHGQSICNSMIEVLLASPSGKKYKLRQSTDVDGLALFTQTDVECGQWYLMISRIDHSEYQTESFFGHKKWFVVNI